MYVLFPYHLYLHHARSLLFLLLGQVHLEVLAHPVKEGKISILMCKDMFGFNKRMRCLLSPQQVLYLLAHPFDHSLLCCHEVHGCPSLLSHPVKKWNKALSAEDTTQACRSKEMGARICYRRSSWSRIAKARSSRVSLKRNKQQQKKSQEKNSDGKHSR